MLQAGRAGSDCAVRPRPEGRRDLSRLLLLVTVGLFLVRPGLGLDPRKAITQYGHDVWRTDQGLPQNSVEAIVQTRQGYLWLGTEEGLVRFDGSRFVVFDKRRTPGLADSYIACLLEDRSGSLWIGTREGGLVRFRDGVFRTYKVADGLAGTFVRCLAEDKDGTLWIGTDAGISRFRDERFAPALTSRDGLSSDAVRTISVDGQGRVWIGTRGGGLDLWQAGRLAAVGAAEGLPSQNVWTTCVSRDGTLWVGTAGAGLARFDGTRFTAVPGLPNAFVATILEDRDGSLWIGTDGGGLTRFRDGVFSSVNTHSGLSNDFVEAIYEDREGSLWVGTQGGGLNRFKDEKFSDFSSREGLSADAIWSIYEDRGGRVWLGTMGEGLNRMESAGGGIRTFRDRDGLPSNNVWCTLEASDGALWVGTRGQGLAHWREGDARSRIYTARDGLAADVVLAILEDRANDLWVATAEGLSRLHGGKFQTFTTSDGLGSSNVLCLLEDSDGIIWAGTRGGGIARWRESDGRFERLGAAEGFGNATVYDIHEDSRGGLWLGTAGRGLVRFAGGRFSAYGTREGLFDDLVYRILEDQFGRLWLTCNRGIFRVSLEDVDKFDRHEIRSVPSVVYGPSDGLRSSECNGGFQPAGWKTRDGRLWFPTIRGAAVIDPANIPVNRIPPPVVIEEAVADNQSIRLSGGDRLRPGRSRFEFRYTALSLLAPERVAFRFKLEGFDRAWIDAAGRRSASYTNLPAGDYRFRVVASNNDGIWNATGASVAFSIAPHFYQTPWFFALCVVGLGLVAEGATVLRVRRLKGRQKELEGLVTERTEQLEEANRGLERLSLLDPLTGIANRRQFERVLEFERKRSERTGAPLALLMIDIDNFKAFNDAHGHVAGDGCLKAVVAALAGSMRGAGDLLARYGGEEFAVVLPTATLEGARVLAERLRGRVEELRVPGDAKAGPRRVTISLGVAATWRSLEVSAEELVSAADHALYVAKQEGRNRVACAPSLAKAPKPKRE